MPKYYVENGLGLFGVMIVEGEDAGPLGSPLGAYVAVTRLISPTTNIGDRTLSVPVPEGGMLIDVAYLREVPRPSMREFASDNPFGKIVSEGAISKGSLRVSYAVFEKALQCSLFEEIDATNLEAYAGPTIKRTLYSDCFYKNRDDAFRLLVAATNSEEDVDDLIFKLRDLKENESNG